MVKWQPWIWILYGSQLIESGGENHSCGDFRNRGRCPFHKNEYISFHLISEWAKIHGHPEYPWLWVVILKGYISMKSCSHIIKGSFMISGSAQSHPRAMLLQSCQLAGGNKKKKKIAAVAVGWWSFISRWNGIQIIWNGGREGGWEGWAGEGKNGVFCNKVIKYFSLIFLHFLFI